jgi:hypothetical protein
MERIKVPIIFQSRTWGNVTVYIHDGQIKTVEITEEVLDEINEFYAGQKY